ATGGRPGQGGALPRRLSDHRSGGQAPDAMVGHQPGAIVTAPTTKLSYRRVSMIDVLVRQLATMLAATVLLLVAWWLFIKLFNVNAFLGKTPADAYKWLFTD